MDKNIHNSQISSKHSLPNLPIVRYPEKVLLQSCPITQNVHDSLSSSKLSDIHHNLIQSYFHKQKRDRAPKSGKDLFSLQPQLNPKSRAILIDWMFDVADDTCLLRQTVYQAIHMVDTYIFITPSVPLSEYQLLGATCLSLSCKTLEQNDFSLQTWVKSTDFAFSELQIKSMEIKILDVLEYDINPITSHLFFTTWLETICRNFPEALVEPRSTPLSKFYSKEYPIEIFQLNELDFDFLSQHFLDVLEKQCTNFPSKNHTPLSDVLNTSFGLVSPKSRSKLKKTSLSLTPSPPHLVKTPTLSIPNRSPTPTLRIKGNHQQPKSKLSLLLTQEITKSALHRPKPSHIHSIPSCTITRIPTMNIPVVSRFESLLDWETGQHRISKPVDSPSFPTALYIRAHFILDACLFSPFIRDFQSSEIAASLFALFFPSFTTFLTGYLLSDLKPIIQVIHHIALSINTPKFSSYLQSRIYRGIFADEEFLINIHNPFLLDSFLSYPVFTTPFSICNPNENENSLPTRKTRKRKSKSLSNIINSSRNSMGAKLRSSSSSKPLIKLPLSLASAQFTLGNAGLLEIRQACSRASPSENSENISDVLSLTPEHPLCTSQELKLSESKADNSLIRVRVKRRCRSNISPITDSDLAEMSTQQLPELPFIPRKRKKSNSHHIYATVDGCE